uniref:Uncharacterized protein n=1 Tax=Myoviridae sp. ctijX18 TaxID=2825154 RepID=A0A8S5USV8_9CAUD|nr:MAG TPA: hypothetical protein [Myoviridae sp. ctijX18]DAQ61200.1 MAG TPA: hypothetical protein [Caudoviricetes sp.]DAR92339.1 MAG TPA: hypothetical protein [Caudoviricetes sp.]
MAFLQERRVLLRRLCHHVKYLQYESLIRTLLI